MYEVLKIKLRIYTHEIQNFPIRIIILKLVSKFLIEKVIYYSNNPDNFQNENISNYNIMTPNENQILEFYKKNTFLTEKELQGYSTLIRSKKKDCFCDYYK